MLVWVGHSCPTPLTFVWRGRPPTAFAIGFVSGHAFRRAAMIAKKNGGGFSPGMSDPH